MASLANVSGLFTDVNLKGYWKFDETGGTTVTDSSSGGNNGTASNASILNNIGGQFGNKGVFVAASSNKVTITDAASLKPTGSFSIGGWVRPTANDGHFFQSYAENTNLAGIRLQMSGANAQFIIGRNTGITVDVDYKVLTGAANITGGGWHQITCVWDGSTMFIYTDGLLDASVAWVNAPGYQATNYVRFGAQNNSGVDTNYYDGDLDEMFLFNGTALSQAQANALFMKGQAPALDNTGIFADTNLKLYYKMDDAGGTTVTDSSGNSNTGSASAASINANDSYGMVVNRGLFDSTASNKVTIADAASLKPTNIFTVGAWFRTSTTSANQMIFATQSQNPNVAGFTFFIGTDNKIHLQSGKNTGGTPNVDFAEVATIGTFTDGKWHHAVGFWQGTDLVIWVDGIGNNSVAWANAPAYAATNYVRVGCSNATGTDANFFNGDLDEIFLLNGTILNGQQMNQLYNGLQGNALANLNDIATDPNLKLYYKFDETGGTSVTDSSTAGNTGIASNASILNNAYGKFNNKAIFIPANTNKVTVTDNASLKPTGNFSIGAWIKPGGSGDRNIFQTYSENPNVAGIILRVESTNVFTVIDGKNTGGTVNVDFKKVSSAATLNDGHWHHVVATWDGSTIQLYVDGVADGSASWANAPAYAVTNYVRVGEKSSSGDDTNLFDGDIDDLFLLNGTALSLGQVQELYRQAGVAGTTLNVDVTSSFLPGVKIV